MEDKTEREYDVVIVGGGPAGLSAALVLARAHRRVVVFDSGKPRNDVAQAVHGYLGLDGIPPHELRARARGEVVAYGAELRDGEVLEAKCVSDTGDNVSFEVRTVENTYRARALLLATGVADVLPEVPGIREFYGRSVHHCPYCDGWEHRDKRLVALAEGSAAAKLALSLSAWSAQVTACTNGTELSPSDTRLLRANGLTWREEPIERLEGSAGQIRAIRFRSGSTLECDAVFFGGQQYQRSVLAEMLGCRVRDDALVQTRHKQTTDVEGVFLAGDADGDTQFAIVAAAEGAIAATAIHTYLFKQDLKTESAR